MGKAGQALRQTLEVFEISQNRLAVELGTNRSTVNQWFNETRDPSAEAVLEIRSALSRINPDAAMKFIEIYLKERSAGELEV